MRGESGLPRLSRPRTLGQRAAWVFAASALALTLALGGCRAGSAHNSGGQTIQQNQSGGGVGATGGSTSNSNGSSTGSSNNSNGSSNSASLQQLQSIDSQNQNDASQLNQSQNDAGVNYSSQENQTQP